MNNLSLTQRHLGSNLIMVCPIPKTIPILSLLSSIRIVYTKFNLDTNPFQPYSPMGHAKAAHPPTGPQVELTGQSATTDTRLRLPQIAHLPDLLLCRSILSFSCNPPSWPLSHILYFPGCPRSLSFHAASADSPWKVPTHSTPDPELSAIRSFTLATNIMETPGASSDTLVAPPSHRNRHCSSNQRTLPATAVDLEGQPDSDLKLAVLESTPPVVPKLLREASDLTWQESIEASKDSVTLIRRRGRFHLEHQRQFRNSLLASVGYLELANAADFAANVWNQIPVPTFAAVLMGIGGTFALCMVFVAIQDFRLSMRNVKLLRVERDHLKKILQNQNKDTRLVRLLENRLGVTDREMGTEIVDRLVMDCLMGFGSVLVGVGTLMAIGGSNPRVFNVSNLLSGYIGNGLAAIFGLVNAIWSGYLIYRFDQHLKAARSSLPADNILRRLQNRIRRFQWHSFINGLNGLVAGAGSMVTAERWWGYVVLIPCIISLIAVNFFWRKKVGYDRPLLTEISHAKSQLTLPVEDLEYTIALQRGLAELDTARPQTIVQMDSLQSMLQFIVTNHMFEQYCESLARDKQTRDLLKDVPPTSTTPYEIIISVDMLFRLSSSSARNEQILRDHAQRFLRTDGVLFFTYRERHLLEVLGYAVWQDQTSHHTSDWYRSNSQERESSN